MATGTVALLVAAKTGSVPFTVLMLCLYGFGVGGTPPLHETVWASYFGRQHLGEIRSVAMPFAIVFGAGGPLLATVLYDRSGSGYPVITALETRTPNFQVRPAFSGPDGTR